MLFASLHEAALARGLHVELGLLIRRRVDAHSAASFAYRAAIVRRAHERVEPGRRVHPRSGGGRRCTEQGTHEAPHTGHARRVVEGCGRGAGGKGACAGGGVELGVKSADGCRVDFVCTTRGTFTRTSL